MTASWVTENGLHAAANGVGNGKGFFHLLSN